MGYGVPLFDGDEPLPAQRPRARIRSLRLWLGTVKAAILHEDASASADRHEDGDHARGDCPWPDSQRQRHTFR